MYIEYFKYTYHKNLAHILNMADPLKHAASWPTPDTTSTSKSPPGSQVGGTEPFFRWFLINEWKIPRHPGIPKNQPLHPKKTKKKSEASKFLWKISLACVVSFVLCGVWGTRLFKIKFCRAGEREIILKLDDTVLNGRFVYHRFIPFWLCNQPTVHKHSHRNSIVRIVTLCLGHERDVHDQPKMKQIQIRTNHPE